jgi:hypothetical protein
MDQPKDDLIVAYRGWPYGDSTPPHADPLPIPVKVKRKKKSKLDDMFSLSLSALTRQPSRRQREAMEKT